jgi:hypothetical protein
MTEMAVLSKIVSTTLFCRQCLTPIHHVPSLQSSVRMKILSKQVIIQLLGNAIDYEKVRLACFAIPRVRARVSSSGVYTHSLCFDTCIGTQNDEGYLRQHVRCQSSDCRA